MSKEGVETVRTAKAGHRGVEGEGGLSGRLWMVQRYVDAMTRDVAVSDEVFEGMRGVMGGEKEIVELSTYIRLSFCFFARPLSFRG